MLTNIHIRYARSMIRRILYTLAHNLLKEKSISVPVEMTENILGLTRSVLDAQTLPTYAQVCLKSVRTVTALSLSRLR